MLFEKLSDHEKNMIEDYISAYGISPNHYGPTGNRASLDYILRHWNREKENLFHLFGDNLILTKHFEFDVDLTRITQNLISMADSRKMIHGMTYEKLFNRFFMWLHRAGYRHWEYTRDLVDIHRDEEFYQTHYWNKIGSNYITYIEDDWFYYEELARNTYNGENVLLMFPDSDKPYQVKKGMRLTRILERIRKAYGDNDWTEEDMSRLNDLIAIARTSANTSFDLCLSIHPLDFMTMSDNDMGWNSCMAWKDHTGDYRQGTVECMNSPSVVMAYIREKNDMYLGFRTDGDSARWTNKSWRQLFLVTPGAIVAVKGYPFQYDVVVDKVLTWLKDLAKENWSIDYPFSGYVQDKDSMLYDEDDHEVLVHDTELYLRASWGYMYNDIGTLSKHKVLANLQELEESAYQCGNYYVYDIPASGMSECMWCGGEITDDDGDGDDGPQNLVYCSNCSSGEEKTRCDCCGEWTNEVTWVDGLDAYLCEGCYNDQIFQDDITGEMEWNDNIKKVYLAVGLVKDGTGRFKVLREPIYMSANFDYDDQDLKPYFKDPDNITTYMASVANVRRYSWERSNGSLQNVVFPSDLTTLGADMFLQHSCYSSIDEAILDMDVIPIDEDYADSLNRNEVAGNGFKIYLDVNGFTHYA